MKSKRRSNRLLKRVLAGILVFALVAAIMLIAIAERTLSRFVLGGLGERFSTTIHSAPYPLQDGSRFDASQLLKRLHRLSYIDRNMEPTQAGEFHQSAPEHITIFLRAVESPFIAQP